MAVVCRAAADYHRIPACDDGGAVQGVGSAATVALSGKTKAKTAMTLARNVRFNKGMIFSITTSGNILINKRSYRLVWTAER